MEEIRKRMARANALLASKEREAYHAEMRLIQQVTSPPFPLADVYLENRRKCSANFSLPSRLFPPRVRCKKTAHRNARAGRKTSRLCLRGSGTAAG